VTLDDTDLHVVQDSTEDCYQSRKDQCQFLAWSAMRLDKYLFFLYVSTSTGL
jgi:hypothetical protein